MKAALIISHGSQSSKTLSEVQDLIEKIKQKSGLDIVHYAFLEIEQPGICDGMDQCVDDGATEIVVVLNFLNAGRHVDEDIPAILENARKKHPNVQITQSLPVGQHAGIIPLFIDLINLTS